MLVIICAQYGKNPSRSVGVTERTRNAGQTDRRMDRGSETNIDPQQLRHAAGYNNAVIELQKHWALQKAYFDSLEKYDGFQDYPWFIIFLDIEYNTVSPA